MEPQPGTPQQDLLIGQTIGNYLVTQKLGEGGMGSVYLAEHPGIGKKVALKVLHSEFSSNREVAERFFNEAKAVNNIGHPNIVDIVDYGVIQASQSREQLVYFIMEYLSGTTLSKLIRAEAPLPPERALGIGLQVGDALAASHKCGIIHRDLKPDNIMLQPRGRERDFVKLLDYGIAKLTGDNAQGSRRTRTGIVMGTPAYMSPEQCDGRGNIDNRTDVYALGIVLYEMLVGRVPFLGEGYGEILVQHLTQPPAPLSQFHMMNPHVEAVVMKALQKQPSLRYPTMDEMMRAMADPVGYVEANGGIVGFGQRQLMPSTAPIPSGGVRLTPVPPSQAPTTMLPAGGTPPPGSLHHNMVHPTPGPGSIPPYTPSPSQPPPVGATPTTLNGATGQVTEPKKTKKTGFIVAAVLVVAAAGIAIAVVVGGGGDGKPAKKVDVATPTDSGSDKGSAEAAHAGSDEHKGSETHKGSDEHKAGTDTHKGSDAHTGSDEHKGSDGSNATTAKVPEVPKVIKVKLTSTPPGADIYIDEKLQKEKTPTELELPRGKAAKIRIHVSGYEDGSLEAKGDEDTVEKSFALKQKFRPPVTPPVIPPNRGSQTATTPPGKGSQTATTPPGKGSQTTTPPGKGSQTTTPPGKGSQIKTGTGLEKPGD